MCLIDRNDFENTDLHLLLQDGVYPGETPRDMYPKPVTVTIDGEFLFIASSTARIRICSEIA